MLYVCYCQQDVFCCFGSYPEKLLCGYQEMRNQTSSENMLFWEYARQIGYRPCAGLCEVDFALIAHNDYHLLLLNQEAMSAK